jgi:hypothetical protein
MNAKPEKVGMLERVSAAFNDKLYLLVNEMLYNISLYQVTYKLLVLLEFIQLVHFSISPELDNIWNLQIFQYVQLVSSFLNFDLLSANQSAIQILVIVCFSLVCTVWFIIAILMLMLKKGQEIRSVVKALIQGISIFFTLFSRLLIIPFVQIAYKGVNCNPNLQSMASFNCESSASQSVVIALSVVLLCLTILLSLAANTIVLDLNPFSKSPIAQFKSLGHSILKDLFKMLLPLYLEFTSGREYTSIYLAALTLVYLGFYVHASLLPDRPQMAFGFIFQTIDATMAWLSLCVAIQTGYDKGSIHNLTLANCLLGVLLIPLLVYNKQKFQLLRFIHAPLSNNPSEGHFLRYIYSMILVAEKSANKRDRFDLHAAIQVYNSCHAANASDSEVEYITSILLMNKYNDEYKLCAFRVINAIIERFKWRMPNSHYLLLFQSYIMHESLNQKWRAVFQMHSLKKANASLGVKVNMFRQLDLIEKEIKDKAIGQREHSGVDILKIMSYIGFYRKIVEECRESQALYLSFWTELNQEKPRAKEMKAIGEKICKCDEKIKVGYAHIIKDNPTDLKTLLLFGNYLSLLLNNTDDSKKVLQKADNLIIATKSNLQYLEDKRIKYSDCSRLSLITISGNPETLGLIKSINLQALQCLDYSLNEVQGYKINKLMPQVYAEHHDQYRLL